MNDPVVFADFLQNVLLEALPRNRNHIASFIPTFQVLLNTTDAEIDTFVQSTHSSNSGRANNARIILQGGTSIGLKSIRFELKDRQACGALPQQAILMAINIAQINTIRMERTRALEQEQNRKDDSTSTMDIPKFNVDNYDDFILAFTTKAKGTLGANKLPIDYVLRDNTAPANYNTPWTSREEKLKNCILLRGDKYQIDNHAIYALYVQHLGSTGLGSSEVNRHSATRNGRQCHIDFQQHYANRTHLQNKAATANKTLDNTVYVGVRRNFDVETYYQRFQDAFNKLSKCGIEHRLSEPQKILKFQANIREKEATKFAISAKKDWDNLPVANQTFDRFYNIFSADLTTYLRQTETNNAPYQRKILNLNSTRFPNTRSHPFGRGRGGRGRSNGRGRGRGFHRQGRSGRGRGGRGNPYETRNNFAPVYGNFVPEAKMYEQSMYRNLTPQQRKEISDAKSTQGWINEITPPPGFTINSNTGYAVPSNAIISAIQSASVHNQNAEQSSHGFTSSNISLPPPPPFVQIQPPPVLPMHHVNNVSHNSTSQAGSQFSRRGTRSRGNDDNTSIVSSVTINGSQYTGRVYDSQGNPLN